MITHFINRYEIQIKQMLHQASIRLFKLLILNYSRFLRVMSILLMIHNLYCLFSIKGFFSKCPE